METQTLLEKTNLIKKNKDVKWLCKYFFDIELTPGQEEIVRKVAFRHKGKLSVCAMTRYGKSFCVALGIGLYILMNKNKKICFIAPTKEQAGILRDYMAELVANCSSLSNKADLEIFSIKDKNQADRLKKEASKNRLTFSNGCEYRIFTGHNDGRALMGFGIGRFGGKIVKDEATLLSNEAQTKISRMLGDNPEFTQEIELFNPWDRDNKAFEHTENPDWDKVHISWKQALKEGRTTKQFIEEQRRELTPLEFTVLYDSDFPEEAEDSIFNLAKIKSAESRDPKHKEILQSLEILKESYKYRESEVNEAKEMLKDFKFVISCDVADKGLDETVMFIGFRVGNYYEVIDHYSEPKSENIEVGRKITKYVNDLTKYSQKIVVNIDTIGIGAGVVSYVKDWIKTKNLNSYVSVKACHFGAKAIKSERFTNMKAENYFRLRQYFIDNLIKIPEIHKFRQQAMAMKWDTTSSEKIKIIDPEDKSPDWTDSLVYFVWKDDSELITEFV